MSIRMLSALRSLVTRGRVTGSAVGSRTLLQATLLENETRQSVELLLPPGYSARPAAGADVLVLQVLGSRDHVVALGGDTAGVDAISDLAAGEFGLRHASGAMIVFRSTGHVKITDPSGTAWEMTNNGTIAVTGTLLVSGDILDQAGAHGSIGTLRAAYDAHTHTDPQGGVTGTTSTPVP